LEYGDFLDPWRTWDNPLYVAFPQGSLAFCVAFRIVNKFESIAQAV